MTAPFPAIVEALGWTLVHFIWQGVAIAGLYRLAEMTWADKGPRHRYGAALGALMAMVIASCATFAVSFYGAMQTPPPVAGEVILVPRSLVSRVLPWVDAAWMAGVAILSARVFADLWRIQRLSHMALPAPAFAQRIFDRTLTRSRITRQACLRVHAFVTEPFVVGIFRSIVYLPLSAVTALPPEQLEAVLAHELEHVRRADYAWNLLQTAVETLFFYHPAVWWLSGRLRHYRELCCDDAALAACRDPLVYATALLSLAEHKRRTPSLAVALTGFATHPSLVARVGRMLGEAPSGMADGERRNKAAIAALASLAAVYVTALTLGGAGNVIVHRVEAVAKRLPAITAPIPYVASAQVPKRPFRRPAARVRSSSASVAESPAASQDPRVVGAEAHGNEITYTVTGPPHGALLTRLLPAPTGGDRQRDVLATYKIVFVAPKVVVNQAYPRGTTALDPDQNYRVVVTRVANDVAPDGTGAALMRVTARHEDPPSAQMAGNKNNTGPAQLTYSCVSAACRSILDNDPNAVQHPRLY